MGGMYMANVIVSESKLTDFRLPANYSVYTAMIDADNYFFAYTNDTHIYLYNFPSNTYSLYAGTTFGIYGMIYIDGYLYVFSSYGYYIVLKDNAIITSGTISGIQNFSELYLIGTRLYVVRTYNNYNMYYTINTTTHEIMSGGFNSASFNVVLCNYPCLYGAYRYASAFKSNNYNTKYESALYRSPNENPYGNTTIVLNNENLGGGFSFILDNVFINTRTGYGYNFVNGTVSELNIEKTRYTNYNGSYNETLKTAVIGEYTTDRYVKFIRWQSVDYNITYSIKNKTGDTEYISSTGNSPISKVRFNFSGTTVQYVFTTLTGNISGTYTPEIPDGFTLAGYSLSPNSTTVNFGLNTEISDSISNDTVFYEVYKKYVPPTTTFNVELYQNTADKLVLDKTSFLTLIDTLSGALRDRCDIINPTIVIEYNVVPDFNYVHIPIWGRYYYVDKIVSVRIGLWEISLTLDERFSYKDGILALKNVLIARAESATWYNPYLVDELIPTEAGTVRTVTEIPNTSLPAGDPMYPFVVAVVAVGLP